MAQSVLSAYFVHSIPAEDRTSTVHVLKLISALFKLVKVLQLLGIVPVLTYLDTILVNWELIDALSLSLQAMTPI